MPGNTFVNLISNLVPRKWKQLLDNIDRLGQGNVYKTLCINYESN